jgi:hypothetical protein
VNTNSKKKVWDTSFSAMLIVCHYEPGLERSNDADKGVGEKKREISWLTHEQRGN